MKEFKGRFCDSDGVVFHTCNEDEFLRIDADGYEGNCNYTPWVMPNIKAFGKEQISTGLTIDGVEFTRAITLQDGTTLHCFLECGKNEQPIVYGSFVEAAQMWRNSGHGDFRFASYPSVISREAA